MSCKLQNQVARQDSRHKGPEESRDAKHAYCLNASTANVGWPCFENATSKESLLWRTTRGKAFSRWPEETLQRHPQKASQKFRRYVYLEDPSFIIGLINTKVKQHKLKLASLNNPLLATLTSLTEIKQANVNHPYNWTDIGDK